MFSFRNNALSFCEFRSDIVHQQRSPLAPEKCFLVAVFTRDQRRNMTRSPNLAMRMRIRSPHRGPPVLKNLNPGVLLPKLYKLLVPKLNDCLQFLL